MLACTYQVNVQMTLRLTQELTNNNCAIAVTDAHETCKRNLAKSTFTSFWSVCHVFLHNFFAWNRMQLYSAQETCMNVFLTDHYESITQQFR